MLVSLSKPTEGSRTLVENLVVEPVTKEIGTVTVTAKPTVKPVSVGISVTADIIPAMQSSTATERP